MEIITPETVEKIKTVGTPLFLFAMFLYLIVSDRILREKTEKIEEEILAHLKSGKEVKVKFIVRCEISAPGKDEEKYDVKKLSGLAALAVRTVLYRKTGKKGFSESALKALFPKKTWKRVWKKRMQKECAMEFLSMEERHNKPKKIISASFEIKRIEPVKKTA